VIELIYDEQKYAEAYQLAREVLAKEPDNLKLLVHLGANGYLLGPLNNPAFKAEAVDYASRALEQLESGKTIDDWKPLAGRELAIAYLNFTVGTLTLEKEPATALTHFIKAVQIETPLKKSPYTYAYIAGAYETGDYAKLSEEYRRNFAGKYETPESKLALANIYDLTDRMIDGYARAVALAGNEPRFAAQKAKWNESLGSWYKFRNGSDSGMSQLIANILTKPLPPLPVRRTSL
jgi:tetratricopeptide (TPR) repeat protein